MIRFLLKCIFRDRSRSLFPTLVVVGGVLLTVVLYSWMKGFEADIVRANANFRSGHLIVMSRAYAEHADQMPNDLAYVGTARLLTSLRAAYPGLAWQPRVRFAGLLDIAGTDGETVMQAPFVGLGADLLSPRSREYELLNLQKALVSGRLPANPGEVLITHLLAKRLEVNPGQRATVISRTMYGGFTTFNVTITGTIRFGIVALDRGLIIADIADVRSGLDMDDATGEMVGFFIQGGYPAQQADSIARAFNQKYKADEDPFAPVMYTLMEHSGLAATLKMYNYVSSALIAIFLFAMSIVLWNAGLLGSIRRYGEFGIRLAIGESKRHLYILLIAESALIGLFGSIIGTAIGIAVSYYLQEVGINLSAILKNASIVVSDVMRARVTPVSFVIGFVPGLAATLLGAAISGAGIYRRQTSQLTKEFEA